MKRYTVDIESLNRALTDIDEGFLAMADLTKEEVQKMHQIHKSPKRFFRTLLMAAIITALATVTAFAAWGIHSARQQEIKADLKIEENNVSSYTEYEVPNEQANGLVLLSSVNDGQMQHVYVNISPVSEKEAAAFPQDARFAWNFDGTEIGGFAAPQLPVNVSLSGDEEICEAVLENSYDKETRTMTLHCYIDNMFIEKGISELGTESLPLQILLMVGEDDPRTFGPVILTKTEEQSRYFDFGHALYHDAELGKDIEIVGLELTPFSAVWKVSYDGAGDFHRPGADWEAYEPWSRLEDKICMDTVIRFSNGSSFSTGGAVTTPYADGVVSLNCGWGEAIDINTVESIELDGTILWKAD